jgi:hypothetical protein
VSGASACGHRSPLIALMDVLWRNAERVAGDGRTDRRRSVDEQHQRSVQATANAGTTTSVCCPSFGVSVAASLLVSVGGM